jgi:glycosyltransferase involved in cell wall biosynthesis
LSGNLGLGVAARHVASLVLARNLPLALFDIAGNQPDALDIEFRNHAVSSPDALPYSITLLVLPPQTIFELAHNHPAYRGLFFGREGMKCAVLMWEHSQLPGQWRPALRVLDVIVAMSHFIRSACETTLDGVLTIPGIFPLRLPDVVPDRQRFQLPEGPTIFVTSFEGYASDRKNPLAAVTAFRRAFPSDRRAMFVIRINNAAAGNAPHPAVVRLRDECSRDARFRLIEGPLSYRDVLTLYASCDAFVSLHRSEGLGLALMEAMALGKPVIATAWSGNMTYMNATNSCLVTYRLVPVKTTLDVYAKRVLGSGARWAEPDIVDAASWMARLAAERSLGSTIGTRAAESMALREQEAERGAFLDELLAISEYLATMPSFQSKKAHRLEFERRLVGGSKRLVLRAYVGRLLNRHILPKGRRPS